MDNGIINFFQEQFNNRMIYDFAEVSIYTAPGLLFTFQHAFSNFSEEQRFNFK